MKFVEKCRFWWDLKQIVCEYYSSATQVFILIESLETVLALISSSISAHWRACAGLQCWWQCGRVGEISLNLPFFSVTQTYIHNCVYVCSLYPAVVFWLYLTALNCCCQPVLIYWRGVSEVSGSCAVNESPTRHLHPFFIYFFAVLTWKNSL